jgi:hypothetical protein
MYNTYISYGILVFVQEELYTVQRDRKVVMRRRAGSYFCPYGLGDPTVASSWEKVYIVNILPSAVQAGITLIN